MIRTEQEAPTIFLDMILMQKIQSIEMFKANLRRFFRGERENMASVYGLTPKELDLLITRFDSSEDLVLGSISISEVMKSARESLKVSIAKQKGDDKSTIRVPPKMPLFDFESGDESFV
jgi:hypothetical protein